MTDQLTARIYDSLVAFNGVACWDVLRLAQMRQYLAEHLAQDPGVRDAARQATAKPADEETHVVDDDTAQCWRSEPHPPHTWTRSPEDGGADCPGLRLGTRTVLVAPTPAVGGQDAEPAPWFAEGRHGPTPEEMASLVAVGRQDATQPDADLLAASATQYHVPVPEDGGTTLLIRRQTLASGLGWAVSVPGYGGGRAWTAEGWHEAISALSVDRLFCWPDAATAMAEARRALAAGAES